METIDITLYTLLGALVLIVVAIMWPESKRVSNVINRRNSGVKIQALTGISEDALKTASKSILKDMTAGVKFDSVNKRRLQLFNNACKQLGIYGANSLEELYNWTPYKVQEV